MANPIDSEIKAATLRKIASGLSCQKVARLLNQYADELSASASYISVHQSNEQHAYAGSRPLPGTEAALQ